MDLYSYFQYAVVTAIIALIVIVLALFIWSSLTEMVFTSNFLLARQFAKMDQEQAREKMSSLDWDMHVESTPGMQNLS